MLDIRILQHICIDRRLLVLYSQRLLLLSIVVVLCAACADATARERCLRLLALSFRVNSRSTCCCVFQLRAGWCSCHVALLALSRDAAAASQLAVHSVFSSRCFFVFALLLVDVTRLCQVVIIGSLFCASALPSFEVSGCLVRFMSISYFLSRGSLVLFWRHYCSPQRLSIRFVFRGKRPDMSPCICWFCHF